MKRKGNSGVYLIQNILNNKIYIGASISIYSRLCDHKVSLRNNVHTNKHLQTAFNKYGEENFIFETLEECDEEYIFSQENYWCNLLNSHNRKFGYNIDPTSPQGKMTISLETRTKMSAGAEKRSVYVYTIYGNFYNKFNDLYKCGTHFNTAAANIHRKMNIKVNKKNIIDSKITRYIIGDETLNVSDIKAKWDSIFSNLKKCSGKYKVYDCFDNFICTANSNDISRILNIKLGTISCSIRRNTYIKTLKINK